MPISDAEFDAAWGPDEEPAPPKEPEPIENISVPQRMERIRGGLQRETVEASAPTLDEQLDEAWEQDELAQDEQVRGVLHSSFHKHSDAYGRAKELERKTGVAANIIRANLDSFEKTYEASQTDPRKWRKENPHLWAILQEDETLGPVVVRDQQLNVFTKAWRSASDFFEDIGTFAVQGIARLPDPFEGVENRVPAGPQVPLEQMLEQGRDKQFAERQERDAPKQTPFVRDETVAAVESYGPLGRALVPFARAAETRAGLEASKLNYELLHKRMFGQPTGDLEERIVELERAARPRDYNEGPVEQLFSDIAAGTMSQVEVLKGAGLGGIGGGLVGGAVGAAVTRSPAGAKEGARLGASVGAKTGAAMASFQLEAGSAYGELLKTTREDGKFLSEEEARGGAIVYGAIASGIELASLGPFLKAFGPVGEAIQRGTGKAFVAEMMKDAGFREIAKRAAKAWGKSAAAEGAEEGVQDATQQAVEYMVRSKSEGRLQVGEVVNLEQSLAATEKGVRGSLGFGAAQLAINIGTQLRARDQAQVAQRQVSALAQLKDSPTLKAAPGAVAELVRRQTGESGAAVTHMHVDAAAFVRLFQDNKADPNEGAAELLGEDGAEKLKEALATGSKLAVPMETYLEKWVSSDVAERLAEDTTTRPDLLTSRQMKEEQKGEVERLAQEIAKQAEAGEGPAGAEGEFASALERQLVATGTYTESQARTAVELQRAFIRTQAERFGLPADKLFADILVGVQRPDQKVELNPLVDPVHAAASSALTERLKTLSPEARASEYFMDAVTGLRNVRAFDATPTPAGKQVAVITSPTIKPINDAPEGGGHHVADAMLRTMARKLHETHPEAARAGTNLLLHVESQAELDQVLQELRAVVPNQAISIVGAIGSDRTTANDATGLVIDRMREEGALPPRGQPVPGLDVASLSFPGEAVTQEAPAELIQSIRDLSDEAYFKRAYVEASTGLLTAEGWEAIPRKKHVAAFDLRGLKLINDKFGKQAGNEFLAQFGDLARDLMGSEFDLVHLHGDEYAVQSNDSVALAAYVELLKEMAENIGARITTPDGEVVVVAMEFWHGYGEGSYDAADADLNARKRRATAENNRGRAGQPARGQPDDRDRDQRLRDLAGRREALRRRARAQGFASSPRVGLDRPGVGKRFEASGSRGYVDVGQAGLKRIFSIILDKNADLSTFIHETGHTFLELMGDLSEREDAPAAIKEDYAKVLKWMGVEKRSDIQTEHHEKWARTFEAYLLEGKSPVERLRRAFDRFRLWLKSVYKSVAALNADLNPEIEGVMSRLLVSDEELAKAETRMGLTPLFRSPEDAGISAEQWQAYLEEQEEARSHVSRSGELRALKDRLRETERWWKDEEAALREQVALEYEALPARKAQLLLQGKTTDGAGKPIIAAFIGGPVQLERAPVVEAVGVEAAKRFATPKKGGIHPDEMARAAGYPTGAQMLQAIVRLPEKDAWVKETAAQRMRERHPDILQDREELRSLVEKGLHGDFTAKWLLSELGILREKAYVLVENPEANKVQAVPKERLGLKPPPLEAIKRAAEVLAEKRQLTEIDAGRTLQAERSSAEKAAKAAAKGDFAQAYIFKQQQLLNMYLWRVLEEAREQRDNMLELASALKKDKARARLGKANPKFRDAVDSLLEALGLKPLGPTDTARASIDSAVDALQQSGASVMFELEPLQKLIEEPKSWKQLTVAEMRNVLAALKNIKAAAATQNAAIVEGKRVERDTVINQLVVEAISNRKPGQPAPSSESGQTLIQWGLSAATEWDGSLLRPERMLSWLGGEDLNSTWFKAMVKPLQDAKVREADLLRSVIKPIMDTFEKVPAAVKARSMELVDGRTLFPTHRQDIEPPTRRFELLMMALNAGNASNMFRLCDGRNITPDQVRAAIDTLTKEEMDWVQSVWDAAEKLWPEARALEERDSGLPPEKIEPQPLVTKHGTYAGGYITASYDRRREAVGERQAAQALADILDPSYVRPGTSHGHLKNRVEGFSGAISLEPRIIVAQFARIAHDLAYREALKSVGGLVLDSRVDLVMKDRLGDGRASQFRKWLQDVGGMTGADLPDVWSKLGKGLRRNSMTAALAYRLPTMFGDPAAFLWAARKIGPGALAAGIAETLASPLKVFRLVHEKSGEIRSREGQLSEQLKGAVNQLTQRGGRARAAYEAYVRHGFTAYEWFEKFWTVPVWLGAYRKGLKAGRAEAEVITEADALVRRLLPAHNPLDQAGVQRNRYLAPFLVFYSWHNVNWNEMRSELEPVLQAVGAMDRTKKAAIFAGASAWLVFSGYVVGDLLSGRGPEPEDEGDERWANWFKRKMLAGAATMVPFGSEVAGAVESKLLGKHTNPRGGLFTAMVEPALKAAEKLLDGNADPDEQMKAIVQAVAPLTGTPIYPIVTPGRYVGKVITGEEQPENAADFVGKAVYGNRPGQPANIPSLISDAIEGR